MAAGADRTGQPQLDAQAGSARPPAARSRSPRRQDESERPGDLVDRDAVQRGLLLVGHEDQLAGRRLDRVVDLHDPRLGAETPGHRAGRRDQVVVGVVRAAVDLGHQRREHRRSRRQLDDLEPGAVSVGQRGQAVVQPQRDRVALRRRGASCRPGSPAPRRCAASAGGSSAAPGR